MARNVISRGVILLSLLLVLLLGGCRGDTSRRPPIHLIPDMDDQPRYGVQAASPFFGNGSTSQPPVPGTIARGELEKEEAFLTGRSSTGGYVVNPLETTERTLARGEERYLIYCSPCHAASGDGRGTVYERSGLESADLRAPRVRALPDGEIFEVITVGRGLMQGLAYPIPVEDRWAIVAHLRKIQEASP